MILILIYYALYKGVVVNSSEVGASTKASNLAHCREGR
jgi:hypothetical protein